ncbi:hypothetical protein [Sphingomonas sp.]|uniref:hypothetical protein n=1 Tax=Sphingomonas sp. TaxID=28214 RepID=UPI0025F624F7|nr:hypothetical protein [Sphingomonas sp.]
MTHFEPISTAADRVLSSLMAGLEVEFGHVAGAALAARFLAAEEVDFYWEARSDERWIGCYEQRDEDDVELDRVAILGTLAGRWFVATMIVDGDGNPRGMMGKRTFRRRSDALRIFAH